MVDLLEWVEVVVHVPTNKRLLLIVHRRLLMLPSACSASPLPTTKGALSVLAAASVRTTAVVVASATARVTTAVVVFVSK